MNFLQLLPGPLLVSTATTTLTMDRHDACRLLGLPLEISGHIASFLGATDFASLRLTCKAVEHALFNQFLRRFLDTKQIFMPDERNVQALVDMSEDPRISHNLQHVTLTARPRKPAHLLYRPSKPNDFPHSITESLGIDTLTEPFICGYGTVRRDRPLLKKAFSNLRDLKTISIWDFDGSLDPGVFGNTTPNDPQKSIIVAAFNSHFLACILAALADAKARPCNLEIHLSCWKGSVARPGVSHCNRPGIYSAVRPVKLEEARPDLVPICLP